MLLVSGVERCSPGGNHQRLRQTEISFSPGKQAPKHASLYKLSCSFNGRITFKSAPRHMIVAINNNMCQNNYYRHILGNVILYPPIYTLFGTSTSPTFKSLCPVETVLPGKKKTASVISANAQKQHVCVKDIKSSRGRRNTRTVSNQKSKCSTFTEIKSFPSSNSNTCQGDRASRGKCQTGVCAPFELHIVCQHVGSCRSTHDQTRFTASRN